MHIQREIASQPPVTSTPIGNSVKRPQIEKIERIEVGIVSLPVIDPTLDLLKAKGRHRPPRTRRTSRRAPPRHDAMCCRRSSASRHRARRRRCRSRTGRGRSSPRPRRVEPDGVRRRGRARLRRAQHVPHVLKVREGDTSAAQDGCGQDTESRVDGTGRYNVFRLLHTHILPLMASSYHKRRTCASGKRGILLSAYSLTRRSPRTSKAASPLRHEKTLKSPADASRGIVQTAVKGFQPFSRERLPALWRPHERPWTSRAHAAASTRPTPRISQESAR